MEQEHSKKNLILAIQQMLWLMSGALLILFSCLGLLLSTHFNISFQENKSLLTYSGNRKARSTWKAPDESRIPTGEAGINIRYGRELIANTAHYLGPFGTVSRSTNGMNCQNCHLQAGTKLYGNNYSAVASTYPKFRARSGTIESIAKRVNDCMERSLHGNILDSNSREMRAIVAYIKWLGVDVKKGEKPEGAGLVELPYLERAADTAKGRQIYISRCQSCHASDGQGRMNNDKTGYQFPPLWGAHSYTNGAGLFRISRFAGYVQANMPLGASAQNPSLSVQEAWDVAAFVNSMPRPDVRNTLIKNDWKDISKKPIDHPYGPLPTAFPKYNIK